MNHEELEESLTDRKEGKKARKLASKQDRSKYKKSDQQQREKQDVPEVSHDLLSGRVMTIVPQGIMVEHEEQTYACQLRGLLKKEKTQAKNLVTVGDIVFFEPLSDHEGVIASVAPRRTLLSRADNLSQKKEQMIAANVDLVLITASVVNPPFKPELVDRYLIAAGMGGITPLVVVNKIDRLPENPAEEELLEEAKEAYAKAGVPLLLVSTETGVGLNELQEALKGKIVVFSGQSGVGKTSLINALLGASLKVGKTVDRTKKGSHTTSYSQLLPLPSGGYLVDTPGIRSFGLWDLKLEEIERYFDEIHELGTRCKFPDCSHTHETPCAVQSALESGELSPLRYISYCALRASIQEEHKRR